MNILITASLIATFLLTTPDDNPDVKQRFIKQLQPAHLLCNGALQYLTWSLATLAHEEGHALADKMLFNATSSIHLGTDTPAKPWLTVGNISIEGFRPYLGYQHSSLVDQQVAMVTALITGKTVPPNQPINQTKNKCAIKLMAGGIVGALVYQLVKGIRHGAFSSDASRALYNKLLSPDPITFHHLVQAFIPLDTDSDAAKVWRECLQVPEEYIQAVLDLEIGPGLDIAGEIYCACRGADPTINAPVHSKVLIGIINYMCRGYAKFSI